MSLTASALPSSTPWVICLCAAWCRTCDTYRAVFDSAAAQHPQMRFVWLDVEDEADLLGDLEIETFPTLLLATGAQLHFCGPLPPQAGVLGRMLAHFPAPNAAIDPEAEAFWARIRAHQGAPY
ncbi:MAG: thioredoxin family protein [Giesbergeria sp.]|uniref:thioredoxin family protein n=1 Tax=Giesbergeria sp. TaxID=2818473 RepID=UPI00262A7309|nr:thioredoxin family protein [Giesbergeria sp.]MDD2608340.1 thioredoxin family protein [Giesbergeria sp.]